VSVFMLPKLTRPEIVEVMGREAAIWFNRRSHVCAIAREPGRSRRMVSFVQATMR
jgi:hypothetical protein